MISYGKYAAYSNMPHRIYKILIKPVSFVLIYLLAYNDIAFASNIIARDSHRTQTGETGHERTSNLSPRSQLTEPEFLQRFALGQFHLAMDEVNRYVDEQVNCERDENVLGKKEWALHRTETVDLNDARSCGRFRGNIRGLEQVVFVKISGLLAFTGQLTWVDLAGETPAAKEFGGLPTIFIDSMYCNDPDRCVQRHEIDEILQWEDFRVNALHIVTAGDMGNWIRKHFDLADPGLNGTEYEGMTSYEIAELFCGCSYSAAKVYKKIIREAYFNEANRKRYFELAHLDKMLRMYPAEGAMAADIAADNAQQPPGESESAEAQKNEPVPDNGGNGITSNSAFSPIVPVSELKKWRRQGGFQKIRRKPVKEENGGKEDLSESAGRKHKFKTLSIFIADLGEAVIASHSVYLPHSFLTALTADEIGNDLSGQMCLDIGTGTGVLGLIMLKRGAAGVVFGDIKRQAINCVKGNAKRLGYKIEDDPRLEFVRSNLFSRLPRRKFNLILFTPSPIDGWDVSINGGYRYRYADHVRSFFRNAGKHLDSSSRIIFRHTVFPADQKSIDTSAKIEKIVTDFAKREGCSVTKKGPFERSVQSLSWRKKGEGAALYVPEETYIYTITKGTPYNMLTEPAPEAENGGRQVTEDADRENAYPGKVSESAGTSPDLDVVHSETTEELKMQNMSDIENLRKMLYGIAEKEKQNGSKAKKNGKHEPKYYTVTYNEGKIRRDSPAVRLLEYYVKKILPMWMHGKNRIKLESSNRQDNGIVWVEAYSDRARTKIIGKGHVDIDEDINGKALRLIGMINMAFLASQIPADLPADRRNEYETVISIIENQFKEMSEESPGPGLLQFTSQGIWIRLPHAAKIPAERVDEYYRLTIVQLEQAA